MNKSYFPVIDLEATGRNIKRLRKERGYSVRDLQEYFGFGEPQAIYKWQWGKTLPSVDNLYALCCLLDVPMEKIIVPVQRNITRIDNERQDDSCRSQSVKKLRFFDAKEEETAVA